MAWTEQCKVVFRVSADSLLSRQKGRRNVTAILKKLSKESGIPFNTLKRWYYEDENSIKNDTVEITTKNNLENKQINSAISAPSDLCKNCGKNPLEIRSESGKPYTPASKFYGLCGTCRKKLTQTDRENQGATEENGELVSCPYCNQTFRVRR